MPAPFPLEFPIFFPGDETPEVDAYARQLKQLLPPGRLWQLQPDTDTSAALSAIAEELFRVDGRGRDLIDESDPRTAEETISDWEKAVGLPDEQVTSIPTDLASRRLAVTQKYIAVGGQSVSFFQRLAAACGYSITIDRYTSLLLRAGFRCGARCYGVPFAYAMRVNVSPPAGSALPHADFERVIRHATHAHITVNFNYL